MIFRSLYKMAHHPDPKIRAIGLGNTDARHMQGRSVVLWMLSVVVLLAAVAALSRGQERSRTAARTGTGAASQFRNTSSAVDYVGSQACEGCHRSESESFGKTPHGQAASLPLHRPELKSLPTQGITVCQSEGTRCFRVFPTKDGYAMSQFDRAADGTESHVEEEKIAFALGKPLMATGYLIQRGNYLFEAPLTFYAQPMASLPSGWGLSPGYENDALGFTRPVVDSCLTCHVGRPLPTDAASNLYRAPIFEELSIGCESCHGPGSLHVKERMETLAKTTDIDTSIVNPKYLANQRADETCMYCHELAEARIPMPGKSFQDYRPGVPLLRTEAIFKSKLLLGWNLEEWSDEMVTSKCYLASKGAMRCSTCHDPHFTPSAEEAPTFYRSKCLTCHQSQSCTLPLAQRQHTEPADNCIACHMAKHVAPKLVKIGGEGTSHRILRTEDEPVPPMSTPQTSVDPKTGLILIDSDSANPQTKLPNIVLLQGLQSVLAHEERRDDLKRRYESLLQEMAKDPQEASVFSALAASELAKRTAEGDTQAIADLHEAVRLQTNSPRDYLLLSELQYRANNLPDAITALSSALTKFPYLPTPYENLAVCYMRLGNVQKAADIVRRGLVLFPADQNLVLLASKMHL